MGSNLRITDFSIVDLNGDSDYEIVLRLKDRSNYYYGVIILHYQDSLVLGYTVFARGFSDLKKDGTFAFDDGVFGSCGYGRLFFSKASLSLNKTVYYEYKFDNSALNSSGTAHYYLYGNNVTAPEYDAAYNLQNTKPNALWYDFTRENINLLFQ